MTTSKFHEYFKVKENCGTRLQHAKKDALLRLPSGSCGENDPDQDAVDEVDAERAG